MYINFEKFNNLFGGRNESKDADVSAYEQSQNEFFNSLEGIKKEYDDKVNSEYQSIYDAYPEDPGYEYVSYTGPTKEQIISDTTSAYQSAFKQEAERLERQFNEDKNVLAFGKDEAYQKAEQGKADARSESKEEKQSAQDSLAAKGMGRSSVYELTAKAYDEALAKEIDEIDSAYRADIASVDDEIARLQAEYESAVKKADIQNALELYKQIEKYDSQRRDDELAVEKYNNDITKKTLDYKEDRRKAISDGIKDIKKRQEEDREYETEHGDYRGEKKDNYEKRLNAAIEYYGSVTDENARAKLIRDNSGKLRSYLGFYFQKLVDHFEIEL